MKTRQDKDVIDCIGLVYAKFSRPIGSGAVYEETRQDNDVIDCTSVLYVENKTVWLWPIELGAFCHENQAGQQHDRLYRCGLSRK